MSTTWQRMGNTWLISHFSGIPSTSGHLVMNAATALLFAQDVMKHNEPPEPDVADVMEAG